MIINNFNKLDLTVYSETLDNGMQVYIVPKNDKNDTYVTLSTKFGSTTVEFIPNGEEEFVKVPYGIAHFLEHKLFEQSNGEDVEEYFSKSGSSCNAYTDLHRTTYLFRGSNDLINNINYLLDYVGEPYFTDENVEKEKRIIIEELKLYKDDPIDRGVEQLTFNMFIEHPVKIGAVGTIESINATTKEDLYRCYNTFYNPNNMVLVITGNVDPELAISAIKENQSKKITNKLDKYVVKEYSEPDYVRKEYEEKEMNVVLPKLFIGYKINISKLLTKHLINKIIYYFSLFVDIKLGNTSLFLEKLKEDQIINNDIDYTFLRADDHLELVVLAETNDTSLLTKLIQEELNNLEVDENEFNRKKKNFLSSNIFMSESITKINEKIARAVLFNNQINYDIYDEYDGIKFSDFTEVIKELNNSSKSEFVVRPLNSCNKD